jgi:hypothetical protein
VSGAARVARHRERVRAGRRCYTLVLDAVELEAMLEREHLLPAGVELDHRDVRAGLQTFMEAILKISRC